MSHTKPSLWMVVVLVALLAVLFNVGLARAAMLRVDTLVDSTSNNGYCTLREAIINANEDAATWPDCPAGHGADVIYLDDLSGTLTLLSDLPPITDPDGLVLHGPGAAQLTISGSDQYRILNVQNGPITVRNLTLRDASSASFGSILHVENGGVVTIWSSVLSSSTQSAINLQGGQLTVVNSTFVGNSSPAGGAIRAIYKSEAQPPAPVVLIDDSIFTGNLAGGGHALHQNGGSLTINNSLFEANGAADQGYGTVEYVGDMDIWVRGCQFVDNLAHQGAALHDAGGSGTLTVEESSFAGNEAGYTAGVIRSGGGRVIEIYQSLFEENGAVEDGGVINSYAAITIDGSTFANNFANMGGVIYTHNDATGPITITNSLFTDNQAAYGGAIWYGRGLYITNSTFYQNTAISGGALASFEGWGEVINSTFDHNGANNGAALYFSNGWGPGLTLYNTILANPVLGNNCYTANGTYPDGGYNLQYPGTSCNVTIPVLDPLLDANGPQDNGGPTWTIALQANSPAMDLLPVGADFPETDQRGAPRPVNGNGSGGAEADAGAYEYSGAVPTPTPGLAATATPAYTPTPILSPMGLEKTAEDVNGAPLHPGDTVRYVVTVTNDGILTHTNAVLTDLLPEGVTFQSASPAASSGPNPLVWNIGTLSPGGEWSATIWVKVNPDADVIGGNLATLVSDQMQEETVGPILPPGGGVVTPLTDLQAAIAIEELLYDVTYTVVFSNAGPEPVEDAPVTVFFPPTMNVTWICVGQNGGSCPASGSGDVAHLLDLPVNGSVTYTAEGLLRNQLSIVNATATIATPANVDDSNLANNTAAILRYRLLIPVVSK